jgi:hypothetical protein
MRYFMFTLYFFYSISLFAQKNTISGVVTDAETGETLVGASVFIKGTTSKGTSTDANGFFRLPGIWDDESQLVVSFVGYQLFEKKISLNKGEKLFFEIKLIPLGVLLGSVDIVEIGSDKLGDKEIEISHHTLTPKSIQSIPSARNDVFKALRYLPGIQSTEPLSPLVSVRGSDPGENLIMLDGVTIYNPYHFLSSSGIFNMQTVKNVDMMVGGFGAEYGGRNSSVINISTKDGNNSGLHGEIVPSTSESKVFLEFPVGDKTTMMVAGRFNYDFISNFMLYSNNYFYDYNLSLTHRFDAKNTLTLKYFGSNDHTDLDFNALYRYMGNSIGSEMGEVFNNMSLKWVNRWDNHIVTAIYKSMLAPNLFLKAQVYGSFHSADNNSEMKLKVDDMAFDTSTRFKSKVNDWCGKISLSYKPFYWNELLVGAEYNNYLFQNTAEINKIDNGSGLGKPTLASFFIEDKIKLGQLYIRPGLRASYFENGDVNWDPRLNITLNLESNWKFQAAWGRYSQFIVSMNTQEFEYNQFLDYYYPLTGNAPSLSYHYIVGVEKKAWKTHTFSVDFYYKDIARTYIFDLNQDQYEAFALSDKIVGGSGKSYGMELLWKGAFNKFSGWAGYTLSRSTRSFPNIMGGKEYDYDYDRRHSFKAVMNYQATKRISYSGSFIAQSGVPRSIENTMQMYYIYEPLTGSVIYSPQNVTNVKNGVRMPWLLYLDLGLQKKIVSGLGKHIADFFGAADSYLTVNVYNVLFFRRNVLYYFPLGIENKMLPFGDNYLPSVSVGYTIKF